MSHWWSSSSRTIPIYKVSPAGVILRAIFFLRDILELFGALRERDADLDSRAERARAMRSEGKTLQEIADALGYKSASYIHKILNS